VPLSDITAKHYRLPDIGPGDELSTLAGSHSRSWQEQLDEPGAGDFSLQVDDADLPAFLGDGDDVVTFSYKGVEAFTLLCEKWESTAVSEGEESDQVRKYSGRGHLAVLERGVIYPTLGCDKQPIEEDRLFNWASPQFDDSSWTTATLVHTYGPARTDWGINDNLDPAWPDNNAKIMWAADGTPTAAEPGDVYFRQSFSIAADGTYRLYVIADNFGEVYIDGQFMLAPGAGSQADGFTSAATADVTLTAGTHYFAAVVTNSSITSVPGPQTPNPAGVAFTIVTVDAGGAIGVVAARSTTAMLHLPYPVTVPGMTPGQALGIVLAETQARGGLPFVTLSFDDDLDTAGTPWPIVADIATKVGNDLLAFVREVSGTYIDVYMAPGTWVLDAWVKGDRGGASGVAFVAATDPMDPLSGNLVGLEHKGEA
jgi:hypothetical protein